VVDVDDADVALSGEYQGRVRMTLTVAAVNRARTRMFLVAGAGKVDAVRRLLGRDPDIPAAHVTPDATTVLLDEAAYPDE
jgi:6-phosphogluconolactonase/glucosamine-6-phosphate isomerase/deaminase